MIEKLQALIQSKRGRIALTIIGVLMFLVGPFALAIRSGFMNPSNEIPLNNVQGMVVDHDRNIYVANDFGGTILKFNSNGEYVGKWKAETCSGALYLDINKDEEILIYDERCKDMKLYTLNGNYLKTEPVGDMEPFRDMNEKIFKIDSDRYRLSKIRGTYVIKKNNKILVDQGLLLSFAQHDFAHGMSLAGGLLLMLLHWKRFSGAFGKP